MKAPWYGRRETLAIAGVSALLMVGGGIYLLSNSCWWVLLVFAGVVLGVLALFITLFKWSLSE